MKKHSTIRLAPLAIITLFSIGLFTPLTTRAQVCYLICPTNPIERCNCPIDSTCRQNFQCPPAEKPSNPSMSSDYSLTNLKIKNPLGNVNSIPELVNNIVRTLLGIVGAVSLLMFVYGGVLWMTSAGNAQRIEKGKETLIWATIGLAVIFASYSILRVIFQAFTGVA